MVLRYFRGAKGDYGFALLSRSERRLFVAFFLCEQALQRFCAVGEPLEAGTHQLSL